MLIVVLADKAPAGIVTSNFPTGEDSQPPDASMSLLTGLPTGVPMAVMAGIELPESPAGDEPFFQADAAIRQKRATDKGLQNARNKGLGNKLGCIEITFEQSYAPEKGPAIEQKFPSR